MLFFDYLMGIIYNEKNHKKSLEYKRLRGIEKFICKRFKKVLRSYGNV